MSTFDIGSIIGSKNYSGFVNSTDPFDLYNFNVSRTGSFQLSLSGLSANADIQLLNSSGATIASSTRTGSLSEGIFLDTLTAGSYTARVFQVEGNTNYNLNLTLGTGTHGTHIDPLTGMPFTSGVFTVGTNGQITTDFIFDGGWFKGELAAFSLNGMESLTPGSTAFIREAARRAITNSSLGHILISNQDEGARISGSLPWEGNWNAGTIYRGVKTFSMPSGTQFGLMLIPNGRVQQVFDNPAVGGNLAPLFSLGTPATGDIFNFGQIADITGDGVAYAWEDFRVDQNPDNDYNDVIFQLTGASAFVALSNDLANPQRNWKTFPVGQQILTQVNTIKDTTSPAIAASLSNDTGASNTDTLTKDPTIAGRVTDTSRIATFRAGFNPNAINFNVLSDLAADGNFTLNQNKLAQINGGSLPDGNYTLYLQAIDEKGNASSVRNVSFTLDTTAPTPGINLLPTSDSGISKSDRITNITTPTITGNAEAGATVQLFNNNQPIGQTTAATNGNWQVISNTLADGTHRFTARATDAAGNISATSTELAVVIDTAQPQLTLTTPVATVPLTPGGRLTGSVNGTGSAIANLSYRFNSNQAIAVALGAGGTFDQPFDFTGLTNGTHILTVTATDTAGNVSTNNFNVTVNIDTNAPILTAALVNDTGSSSTDKVTKDPTIAGTVTDNNSIASFQAGFSSNSLTYNLLPQLASNGSFTLNSSQLAAIKGSPLADGNHTLYLQATDTLGNVSSVFQLTFTLDTTAPGLTLTLDPQFDTAPVGDNITELQTVTLVGQTEANLQVSINSSTATADALGRFELTNIPLALGENNFTASTTDIAGNTSEVTKNITRTASNNTDIILSEGNSFKVTHEQSFTIPSSPSFLRFTIADIDFDTTDAEAINDALEVALVDSQGRSLVRTIGRRRDAFFNLTEGLEPALAAGVKFEGNQVSLDLSDIQPGTTAKLLMRLVNNDGDVNTTARIRQVEIVSAAGSMPIAAVGLDEEVGSIAAIDLSKYKDVSASMQAAYGRTTFNQDTEILSTVLAIKNEGTYRVRGEVLVGITNISDPTVRVRNADWVSPDGIGYYKFDRLGEDGILVANETTSGRTLEFYNPNGVQFDYDLVVLSRLNQVPVFTSSPDVEAVIGRPYVYDVDAKDKDSDRLTYSLLSAPSGMTIDAVTGKINWTPLASQVGNHAVRVKVVDGQGGEAFQQYSLATIVPPPNRPPVFSSTPVVDASVNAPYLYQAVASDADSDNLTFSLVSAPTGMTVNAQTGVVSWTPSGIQVGSHEVKLLVNDGVGGTATQEFTVLASSELGNNAPVIVSSPVTRFNLANLGNSSSGNVNPNSIDLNLGVGEVATLPIGLTLPLSGSASGTDTVFVVDRSGSMGGEFQWLSNIITQLDAALVNSGIDSNRYGIVTFDSDGEFLNAQARGNDLTVTLYGPNNQWLDQRIVDGGDWLGPLFETTLPTFGHYTVLLTSPLATSPVGYGFQVTSNSNTLGPGSPITSTATTQSLNFNTPITGLIANPNEKDIFTFSGTPGQQIYFDALEAPDYDNIYVNLVSPSGNLVLNGSSSDFDANNLITLTESGTYSLAFGSYSNTGDYNFQLLVPAIEQPLLMNTPIADSLSSGFEKALYRFDGTPGQRLYFDSLANANGSWTLYGPDNQSIADSSLGSDFEVTLSSAGSYTLMVYGYNSNTAPVNYNFKVTTAPTNVLPLNFNAPITGEIALPGETDVFTFIGTSGTKLYYDALEGDYDFINAKLISPSGSSPSGSTIFSGNSDSDSTLVTLTETGTYRLIFDGWAQTTGDYKFQMLAPGLNAGQNLSTPVTARLDSGFSKALYQFNGTAGTRIVFDSLANANANWSLYKPDNQYLNGGWLDYVNYDYEVTLPLDGSYTLMVEGNNSPPGVDYSFQVLAPTQIVTSNSVAPSNSSTQFLSLNSPITGSISSGTERDIFNFYATSGTKIFYDALEAPDYDNIYVNLVSPSGNLILDRVSSDSDSNKIITLTESGTYSLAFGNYNTTGDYNFQILVPAIEQPLSLNTQINNSLTSGFERALYRFDGTPGQRLYFDSLTNASGQWELYGPTNQKIGNNYLTGDFEVTLPDAGSYTLMLFGNNSSNDSVNYNFKVTTPPTNFLPLNLNAPVTGEIAVNREIDTFTFNGTAGTTLFYDALEADGDNILVTLVTPSGNKLLSRYNTDYDSSSPSLFTLTETGTYHLIFDANSLTTGDYKFQLFAVSPSDRLGLNQTVESQLTSPQQTALYQFNGTAGQRVTFAPVSSLRFGTAVEAAATARTITGGGGEEDGYAAIDAAISHNGFRPAAAKNAILITDEDRDISQAGSNFNFGNILNALNAKDVLLNVAVSANFANSNNVTALGVDASGNAYTANGAGGYLFSAGGRFVSALEPATKLDYIDLAHANGGVAWDLTQLRAGGQTAQSFSNAFVNQLKQQIESQLTLDVVSSDSNAGFQNLTGTLSGITGGETATFNAKFTGDGETRAFDLLFKRPETNAILGSIPVTINANTTYFYPVQAIDADGDSLTYSLTQAPASASIDSSTGRISWKPPAAGNYEFTVKVTDAKGGIATQKYSVNVTAGGNNNNPEITSTTPPTATVGQSYTYKLTATDADSDRLNYYLINPPQGAAINKDTGVITWTPTQATAFQEFTVRVLDGRGGKATRTFTIPVSAAAPNDAPAIDSNPGTQATVSQLYRYDAIASDPNADNVQFDLVLKPQGMTVDAQQGTLVWQPTPEQVGDHTVVLRASDGRGGVDLQSFVVKVGLPNSAPEIASIPTPSATLNRPYQYQVLATDADGDNLSYRLNNPPAGMTIDNKGIFKWTPNSLSTQQVNIIVSDGKGGETTQTFNLNVLASAPNTNPEITSTPRQAIGLGQNYFYQVTATDANSDPLTYSLVTAPTGMTIDERGRIFWQPQAHQFGNNNVKVRVADGVGGEAIQDFTINVRTSPINNPPAIDSTPGLNATVGQQYRYDLIGNDSDSDVLLWSLDNAPAGMSIDPEKGTILWTPTSNQIGDHEVSVRVTDAFGAYVGQGFTLSVRGVNVAPTIISSPPTVAAVNKVYKYAVLATDLEKDALNYFLVNPPSGMTINRETGLIEWTPAAAQLGSKDVEVLVEDSFGGKVAQKYTVVVSSTAANLPPAIASTPVYAAAPNQLYRYNVTANDPEGESLQYGLIKSPPGMTINSTTGVLEWTPTSAGEFEVVVGATDASGKGGAQQFWVTVAANDAPIITSTPPGAIAKGKTYQYDVRAVDPNGDVLSYTLNNAPQGMTIDELGRIRWSGANPGSYTAEVVVEDTRGAKAIQPLSLNVVADTTAPKVNLWSSRLGDVNLGESVTFVVNATDDVGVESVELLVNGTRVALDGQGRATVPMSSVGVVEAIATATDVSGNTATTASTIRVIDSSDIDAPVLEISNLEDDVTITSPIAISGTVNDSNLTYYTLSVAPVAGGEFKEVFRGNSSVTNGVIATFDPSTLENDSYILRFEAHDAGGNVSSVERVVNVEGELKLGNFRLSFTDLEIPVSGIPISVTRTYDTLTTNTRDDFGYGWRLEFRDTDLRTSLKPDRVQEELGVSTVAFAAGTKVFITLPGGKREAFTFSPKVDRLGRFVTGENGEGGLFRPAFSSQKGSTNTLTVRDVVLTRVGNEYFGLNGEPFNPENPAFGRVYVLTTKEGVVYEIDAKSGDLLTVTDNNGNKLTYTDAGIASSSGKQVTFERDALGRIVSVLDPMGKVIRYEYDAKGDLVAVTDQENNTTTFEYNSTRLHYLDKIIDPLMRTGVRNEYDESGRLKKIIDANGNPVELVYDPANFVQTVKDALGNPTTYEYDSRGNIVTEIDALGGITRRTFDENNNLLSETNPEGEATTYTYDSNRNKLTETDPLGNVTRYTYGAFGRLLTKTNPLGHTRTNVYSPSGNLISTKDALGITTTFTYDLRGQALSATDVTGRTTRFEYDNFGNRIRVVDALGNGTTYTYDANGNQLTETNTVTTSTGLRTLLTSWGYDAQGRVTTITDPEGNITRIEYDNSGNQTATIDALGRRTEYRYDDKNQLVEARYADSTSERFAYDAAGREIATIDQLGQTTRFTYDALGRQIETIHPDNTPFDLQDNPRTRIEYDKVGQVKAEIDELGHRTEYTYDVAGRRTAIRDALGNRTTYTYNAAGKRLTQTDALNRTTQYSYNLLGQLVSTRFADGTNTTISYDTLGRRNAFTNQAGKTTRYEFDVLNRVTATFDPLGYRTTQSYDEIGNLIGQTDANDRTTTYKYDGNGRLTTVRDALGNNISYAYDAVGNQLSETDALGRTTQFTYNSLDRLTKVQFADNTSKNTVYDAIGRVIAQTDQMGLTTQYEYDAQSRLTAVVDAMGQRTTYGYNKAGNLIRQTDANNRSTTYEYDALDRRTAVVFPLGQRSTTTYDAVGNILGTTDANGRTINYQYDPFNRRIKEQFADGSSVNYTYTATGKLATVSDNRGVTSYTYDGKDRQISRTDPDGKAIQYTYDPVGNRTSVIIPSGTTTYTYDASDRLATVTDPNFGVTRYTYDANDNLIRTELPSGIIETREYDTLNRLLSLENRGTAGLISSYRYTLNPVGHRTAVDENGGRRVQYTYDNLHRLTQEAITDPVAGSRTLQYTYDAVGNRLSHNDSVNGLTNYTYDANDRLLAETRNNQVTQYTYDNNGNTLSRMTNAADQVVYRWDGQNRLTGADVTTASGTSRVEYRYNSEGVRVASIVDGQETRYLIDTNQPYAQVMEEYAPGGTIGASYVYGRDLISQKRGGQQSFYLVDGLGSTRSLTNASGNVTDTYTYDAFGNLIGSTGGTANNYRFAGEQFDPNLSDYYLRQRYYDPSAGRFTRRDTYEGRPLEPVTLHKYLYGNANPVNFIDPSGLYAGLMDQSNAIAVAGILAAIGYVTYTTARSYNPEPLGGFDLNGEPPRFLNPGGSRVRQPESLGGTDLTPIPLPTHTGGGLLDNVRDLISYLFSIDDPGILPDDHVLEREAEQIALEIYDSIARTHRTIAVGQVQGSGEKVVANSFGEFTDYQQKLIESHGYTVYEEGRGSYPKPENHAERRLIRWSKATGNQMEAIGVSHPKGICSDCWSEMQKEGIRRGSRLK